jgi:hydroxypyruvate isomerase
MLKFSANVGLLFTELPFLERFHAARDAGFDAVEFPYCADVDAPTIRDALNAADIPQSLANVPYEVADLGLAAAPGQRERFVARLELALAQADVTGCKTVHVLAGKIPTGISEAEAEQTLMDSLRCASDLAARAGGTVVIEAINRRAVPDFSLQSVHHAARIVEAVNLPNVRLLLDLYHAGTVGDDMPTVIREYAHLTSYVQIAGFKNRREPGDGAADYIALLQGLSAAGYQGYVGAEYMPGSTTTTGLSWLRDAKLALR